MPTQLPNTGLNTGFLIGESGWADEMNLNLRVLDALVQARVIDKDLTAPPGASSGDLYIVGPGSTGDWAGQGATLAYWQAGPDFVTPAWVFITPKEGWRVWVIDELAYYQFQSGLWVKDESSELTDSRFAQDIGDGSAANFFIDHLLGTRDVHVTVYRNASPWDDIVVDVTRPSANQVEISGFGGAPSAAEYRVVVTK